MRNRIQILPDRERRRIMYRYGLSMSECKTISETAALFNLTEKYAAEIERNTLKLLKDGMNDGKIV
jgi:DNA-directed RNA polymerase sigma subunit (sigma70/sigma32)